MAVPFEAYKDRQPISKPAGLKPARDSERLNSLPVGWAAYHAWSALAIRFYH
jgi:hypothetical protein